MESQQWRARGARDISFPLGTQNVALAPDLDLHAFTPDGKHVGMNYTTGKYENEISGAVASGNLFSGDKWIFVPSGTLVNCARALIRPIGLMISG